MCRLRWLRAAALAAIVLGTVTIVRAQQYTRDQAASEALTRNLHKNRLPMVGAQVLDGDDGSHQVILYGFVATDKGRYDAEQRARKYLGNSEMTVDNRVVVDPKVRKPAPPPPDYLDVPPPPMMAAPSTSIFDAPPGPVMRYPTPLPTIVPNLFAP